MGTINIPLQLKRTTSANRTSYVPVDGEAVVEKDTKMLYIGDGLTPGGFPVGGSSGSSGKLINMDFTYSYSSIVNNSTLPVTYLSANYTPQSATSKLYIDCIMHIACEASNFGNNEAEMQLYINGSAVQVPSRIGSVLSNEPHHGAICKRYEINPSGNDPVLVEAKFYRTGNGFHTIRAESGTIFIYEIEQ